MAENEVFSVNRNNVYKHHDSDQSDDNVNYEQLVTSKDTDSCYHTILTDHTSRDVSCADVDSSNYLVLVADNNNDTVDSVTSTQIVTNVANDSYGESLAYFMMMTIYCLLVERC